MNYEQARARLRAAVKKAGGLEQASKDLQCSKSVISYWLSGGRRPARMAHKIEKVYRIPATAWLTPDER